MGTSQTCRGCRGDWKLGSLEVWRLGFLGGAPSPVYRALCSPWAWKVCGFAAARSVLRSPGRGAAPHSQSVDLLISQFLCVLCGSSVPLWVPRSVQPHRRQRRQPGLQPLWLLQASKPLNLQASLERPSCSFVVLRVLRVFPKTFHAFPSTLPVARLPRVPFSGTLCFLFSRGGLAAPYAIPFRLP